MGIEVDGSPESIEDRSRSLAFLLAASALLLAVVGAPERKTAPARGVQALARDASGRLELNRAGPEDLLLLPAIGPKTAAAVTAFREVVRPFLEVGDLSLLPGISENRLSRLLPYLEVRPVMSLSEAGRAVLSSPDVDALLRLALTEDVGNGDVTTALTVPSESRAEAALHCREAAVICGGPVLQRCVAVAGADLVVEMAVADGASVEAGAVIGHVRGRARDLVTLERVLLNILQRMSGVATRTRRFVEAAGTSGVLILETRKTVPGWRRLDKYAVLAGGGSNHRMGLYDAVLLKENHFALAGDTFGATIARVLANRPEGMHVQVEVETLDQLDVALSAGVDSILLDNMSDDQMREAVQRAAAQGGDRPLLEASGGITLERIKSIAATGVDRISVGALTHSVPAVDISLLVN